MKYLDQFPLPICGSMMMLCGLFNATAVQDVMLVVGSVMVVFGVFTRCRECLARYNTNRIRIYAQYVLLPIAMFVLVYLNLNNPSLKLGFIQFYWLAWSASLAGMLLLLARMGIGHHSLKS